MPSVSPRTARLAAPAICAALLLGAASGCSTTQDKAAKQQAKAEHILKARADRQQTRKKQKQHHAKKEQG